MAANSKEAQKRTIEKAIIRSTIGRGRFSSLPLFDQDAKDIVQLIETQASTRIGEKVSINPAFIQRIVDETKSKTDVVKKILNELLNSKRIQYIFELAAEVALEKLSEEKTPEIEQLQAFSYFLSNYILYYPYLDFIAKNTINNAVGSRTIPVAFTNLYYDLTSFQEDIKQEIATLKEQAWEIILEEEWGQMSQEKREKILKEEREKILREKILKEERGKMPKEEWEKMSEEEWEKMWKEERENILRKKAPKKEWEEMPKEEWEKMWAEEWEKMWKEEREKNLRKKEPEKEWEEMSKEEWEKMWKEKWKKMFEGELERRLEQERKKKLEKEWMTMPEEGREKMSTEKWEEIPEEERERRLKEGRNERLGEERDDMLRKEEERFLQISLKAFPRLFAKSQKWLDGIPPLEKLESHEGVALKKQLTAVHEKQKLLAERVAQKEAALKALEKEEILEIHEKKKPEVLPETELLTEEERAIAVLKDFYISKGMSVEEAERAALDALKLPTEEEKAEDKGEAVNASIDPSSAAQIPPPPPPPKSTAERVDAALLKYGVSPADRAKAVAIINKGKDGSFTDSIIRRGSQLKVSSKSDNIPSVATKHKYPAFTKAQHLEPSKTLHVLPALPGNEALGQLRTGYVLVDPETANASLYHVDEGILIKCDSSDLAPLCKHVNTSLSKGQTEMSLDGEEQRKFIVAHGGGYNYIQAKAEAKAEAKTEALSSSILAARLPQSGVPQKLPRDEYKKVLLKAEQDWPESKDMVYETLYFKLDLSNGKLTRRYKSEDGAIVGHEREMKASKQILTAAFAQSELTVPVIQVLNRFDKIAQVLSIPSGKEEEVKKEGKVESVEKVESAEKEGKVEGAEKEEKEEKREIAEQASDSNSGGNAKLFTAPSSPSFFTLPLPLPAALPKSLTKETNVNPPAEESSADSKLNSGKVSPKNLA